MNRDELAEKYLDLVETKVRWFLREFPRLSRLEDDLVAEGQLALVEAAQKVIELRDVENVRGYLGQSIERAIALVADREAPIYVPKRTKNLNREKGRKVSYPRVQNCLPESQGATHAEFGLVDVWNELEACCRDELDRQILRLRAENHTNAEIATQLDQPLSLVHLRKQRLEQEFYKRREERD